MSIDRTLIYDVEVTAVGPLVDEFTGAGIWVFFRDDVPEEIAAFALLHHAAAPRKLLAPSQIIEIEGNMYTVTAVGDVANQNVETLGHLVLKANGLTKPEMPGDVCIEAQALPEPTVGMHVRVWAGA